MAKKKFNVLPSLWMNLLGPKLTALAVGTGFSLYFLQFLSKKSTLLY